MLYRYLYPEIFVLLYEYELYSTLIKVHSFFLSLQILFIAITSIHLFFKSPTKVIYVRYVTYKSLNMALRCTLNVQILRLHGLFFSQLFNAGFQFSILFLVVFKVIVVRLHFFLERKSVIF